MDREKENRLFRCKSLNEFLTMFFGYGINEQLGIFDEVMTIKAGTFLYRARKDDGKTNFYKRMLKKYIFIGGTYA